jgi:hypothetical protein
MTARHLLARLLLAVYPSAWRREYGEELMDILALRAMTLAVVSDVLSSALRQRLRTSRPSTILGLASLSLILGRFVLSPMNYGKKWTALLQPVATTFPPVAITFVTAEVYVLCMVACGCWTQLRSPAGPLKQSGAAAMRMSLIAGVPITVVAVLMLVGVVDLTFMGAQPIKPLPWVMLLSPVLRLPEAWIWGVVGGLLGRWFLRSQQSGLVIPG